MVVSVHRIMGARQTHVNIGAAEARDEEKEGLLIAVANKDRRVQRDVAGQCWRLLQHLLDSLGTLLACSSKVDNLDVV